MKRVHCEQRGVRIHHKVEGSGTPLVLHHGTAGCGEIWKQLGYANVLKRDHRLILLDAPGTRRERQTLWPSAYKRLRPMSGLSLEADIRRPTRHVCEVP